MNKQQLANKMEKTIGKAVCKCGRAAEKKADEKINLDSILFKCRDILRAARNSGSFFEKRDMMLN